MSKKADEVISYFENLYKGKAIYLWGANSEVITKELCDKLYKNFGSSKYDKAYYNNKFKEGRGKIGADCSGSMYPMSGYDTTAQGYYRDSIKKGNISSIDKQKPCLVFKGNSTSSITHIGFYLGNGYVIEMKSSKDNCVKDKLDDNGWKYYGIPAWIDYTDYKQTQILPKETKIEFIGKVNTKYGVLNIRKTPDASSQKVGTYNMGELIQITAKTDNGWFKTKDGYVSGNYMVNATGKVTDCYMLNFRKTKKVVSNNIIKELPVNTELYLLKDDDVWYKVKTKDNAIGYVHKKYVQVL